MATPRNLNRRYPDPAGRSAKPAPRQGATQRYGAVAQALHWLVAVWVLSMFGLGWYMVRLPLSLEKFNLYQLHKWSGITIFAVAALRLLWRWRHPAPPLPPGMPGWERTAAKISHGLLYALLLIQPTIGFLQSNAANFPVVLWGVLPLPALIGPDEHLGETLLQAHHFGAFLFVLLVLVHVAAALRHHFLLDDDVLRRMLPASRLRR
jgi:cytochrome b561